MMNPAITCRRGTRVVRALVVPIALLAPGPVLAAAAGQLPASSPAPATTATAAVAAEPCPAGAVATRTYAVNLVGNRAGYLTSCDLADGSRVELFAFNDRGRGPKTRTLSRRDAAGVPLSLETSGNDYLKSPVDERFTREAGRAVWSNKAEHGEQAGTGDGFYLGYSSPPSELADLARALLQAPERRLVLLPEGAARLERRGEQTVSAGGAQQRLEHYTVSGLGFSAQDVWLEPGGERFVIAGRWLSVAPDGWETALPALLEAQEKDAARRAAQEAKRIARRPAAGLAIRNARLFDPLTGTLRPGTSVVVSGDTISAVGPDAEVSVPEGAEVIDAAGRVLLPGLWDMHVHVGPEDGALHLAAGVTSVRDLANDPDALDDLSGRIGAGEALGPRIVAAGFIDGPGPYQGPTQALAATEAEAREWVRRYAARGYRQIKLYSSLKPELVPVVVDEAHKHGMRVSGHIPAFMTAEQAVRAGYNEIQHMNMLFLNFFFDEVQDTRTPARFTAVAERAAELDLGSQRVQALLALLKEKGVVVDPTLAIFEQMFEARPGEVRPGFETVSERLPSQVRRELLDGGLPLPDGREQRYRDSFDALLRMLKRLHDAGIPIVAGTDDMPGFALQRELELYVRAGLTPAEVLRLATLGAARVAGREAELGTLAPGKLADMALVDGDPLADISAVRKVSLTIKGGVLYDVAALLEARGVRP